MVEFIIFLFIAVVTPFEVFDYVIIQRGTYARSSIVACALFNTRSLLTLSPGDRNSLSPAL